MKINLNNPNIRSILKKLLVEGATMMEKLIVSRQLGMTVYELEIALVRVNRQ